MSSGSSKPFCIRSDDGRLSPDIIGWLDEDVQLLNDWLDKQPIPGYVSYDLSSSVAIYDEQDVRAMLEDAKRATIKRKETALEKKLKQYNKLKEELGL